MSDIWGAGQAASGIAQAAAVVAAAGLQYKSEMEKLKLQKEIWQTQKRWAGQYHDLWYEKYRPVEIAFLSYIAEQEPYLPQYDAAQARALTTVRAEFATAREKARRCIDPRCTGALCATERELAIEEAKAAVSAVNQGYRTEEARKDVKEGEYKENMFALLQLGRGMVGAAMNSLQAAAQTAHAAQGIDPYSGFAKAFGSIAGMWAQNQADKQTNKQLTAGSYFAAFRDNGNNGQGNNGQGNSGYHFDFSAAPDFSYQSG